MQASASTSTTGIRRVVTTHDSEKKAVILSDGPAPNVRVRQATGIKATLVWTTSTMPAAFSNDDLGAVTIPTAPPPNHTVLRVVEFPPYDTAAEQLDNAAATAEMGLAHDSGGRLAPRHAMMHATDSVDYAIVLEGEIDMLLDEGEVHLNAGDILIQQGTNHAWVNRSDRPCKIVFVLIDAGGSPLVPQ